MAEMVGRHMTRTSRPGGHRWELVVIKQEAAHRKHQRPPVSESYMGRFPDGHMKSIPWIGETFHLAHQVNCHEELARSISSQFSRTCSPRVDNF